MTEALHHGGIANDAQVKINWVNAEEIEENPDMDLDEVFVGCKGILVPGGFGSRGVEGKIKAIQYAREHKIPFLGLCLGMQCAVIEFARHVCGMEDAHSTEFDPETTHPVISLMESQQGIEKKGGTMRLGSYPCTPMARMQRKRTARTSSMSVIAIVSSSTMNSAAPCRKRAWSSPARCRMTAWSR